MHLAAVRLSNRYVSDAFRMVLVSKYNKLLLYTMVWREHLVWELKN
jgi:hypothetical protein